MYPFDEIGLKYLVEYFHETVLPSCLSEPPTNSGETEKAEQDKIKNEFLSQPAGPPVWQLNG